MKLANYIEDADSGKIADTFPLFPDVIFVSDNDDMLELIVIKVACTQWHDEVAETNQSRVGVGKYADYDVIGQNCHGRLISSLQQQALIVTIFIKNTLQDNTGHPRVKSEHVPYGS